MWAGIIGVSFGLVIAFGAWRVRSSVVRSDTPVATATPRVGVEKNRITIDKPRDFDVITASSYTVSGITKSSSWVVVSVGNTDYFTQSATDGSFSVEIEPEAGINKIKATSINDQGDSSSQEVLAVYSSSFQSEPTEDSESSDVDSEVLQKIAEAENPPKAYIGTVTDIADSTIQIKSVDSQIQQIATDKFDVAVVNAKDSTSKVIKLTDIAIGDYIIAMGYVDGNDVLDAKRILVSSAVADTKITVSIQKVESVDKKFLTVTPPSGGEETTFTPDKNTEIISVSEKGLKNIKMSDISASDTVITVLDTTGTPAISRAVFAIENKGKDN